MLDVTNVTGKATSAQMFPRTAAPIGTLVEVDFPESEIFLDAVSDHSSDTWRITVNMLNKAVEFQINTGAYVTTITEDT